MTEPNPSQEAPYSTGEMTRLSMAGLARNVGYGTNKVFAADLLSRLTPSQALIGLVLGMEGLCGLVLNPLTGWISDRYHTRFGRRRLFILISTPLAGLLWVAFSGQRNLHLAIIFLISFYFFQQVAPTPLQAWMPDIVAKRDWGRASGVITLWWEVGSLLAFLPIPLLWESLHQLAFWVVALIMIGGGLVTGLMVRERRELNDTVRPPLIRTPWLSPNLIKYFIASFLWWLAFEAMASFFTLFVIHTLHGTLIDSALGMTIFTLAGIVVAIWFGRIYSRRSPKLILILCFGVFGLIGLAGTVIHTVTTAFLLLFVEGVFWGGMQVISYPWGSELLGRSLPQTADASEYYGLLYGVGNLTQAGGLLVAAPAAGLVIGLSHGSYSAIFLVNAIAAGLGVITLATIREHGSGSEPPQG